MMTDMMKIKGGTVRFSIYLGLDQRRLNKTSKVVERASKCSRGIPEAIVVSSAFDPIPTPTKAVKPVPRPLVLPAEE